MKPTRFRNSRPKCLIMCDLRHFSARPRCAVQSTPTKMKDDVNDDSENRADHRRHRPGRRLFDASALDKGYMVHGVKRRSSSFNTGRIEDIYRGSACSESALRAALWRHDRRDQPDPPRPGNAARRDLQSRGAEPCPGEFRDARIHRQRRRHRHASPARGDPHPRAGGQDALLSGVDLGALRPGPGGAAERDDALLSALALCRRQALRLLDRGQLPRGLWHARLQRHPVQPRKPAARRDLRHPQDHARRRRDQPRAGRRGSISAISTPSATGAMRANMSKACG